jgi:hypothetical protein
VTPPENTERGAGAAANGEAQQSSPPWQRVAKEMHAPGGEGPTAYLPQSSGDLSGPVDADSRGSGHHGEDDRLTHTGDLPIVTGVAANRLFGGAGPHTGPQRAAVDGAEETSTSEGHDTVSTPSASTTRDRPVASALRRPGRGPRRASLQVKRFDPWSVLKLTLVLGVAMFFVWLVAVGLLYTVLDGMGVWDKLNGTYSSLVSAEGADAPAEPLISAGRVFGVAAIVGMINIVLLSALATVCAFIYNVSADLAGGLEVTLSERE